MHIIWNTHFDEKSVLGKKRLRTTAVEKTVIESQNKKKKKTVL